MTNFFAQSATHVPEVDGIDLHQFKNIIQNEGKPIVLRQLVKDWPAVQQGASSAAEMARLISKFSLEKEIGLFEGAPKGRFFYTDDLMGFNFERISTTLNQLFERLIDDDANGKREYYYAGAVNIPQHLPGFANDHLVPLLADKNELLTSIWVGTRSRIPLHWDLPENIACLAAGRRAFTLLPMEQLQSLYIGPLERTIAGQPCSLVDFHDVDLTKYPRFADAIPYAMYTELMPGDAIYIPSMWLHHVESLENWGMLVNFWWREGPPHLITPMSTMMHGLLSLKGMPFHERQAWKILFDAYLFGDQDKAIEHIPEAARGLWGNLSSEDIQKLRRILGSRLLS